jgi:D-alanyl-D-alanine carboxypeptidase
MSLNSDFPYAHRDVKPYRSARTRSPERSTLPAGGNQASKILVIWGMPDERRNRVRTLIRWSRSRRQFRHLQVASLLLGVALLGVGSTGTNPSTRIASTPATALKPISQAALQTVVDATARELLVPGALVLLRTPQGDFTVSYGTTQLGTTNSPGAGTYFRIASNTKTMTAAVIMQLAQEGKLALVDPVSKYVTGVPNGDHITIAELLDMRSGLYNYTYAPEISAAADRDPAKVWTPAELLALAFAHPPNFPPGTTFEYCNTNYALLGVVIEKVGGKPLAEAMQDRLFGPLGLRQTALPPSTVYTLPKPYSHGYLYGNSSIALADTPPYSPALQAAARAGILQPKDYTGLNHSFAAAAGGVVSTANDLATWIQALVAGRVLNAAYQQRWSDSLRPEDPSKPGGQEYGYGITRLKWGPNAIYFHGGETPGYNSFMGYDPKNHVTLVVWTNLTLSLDGNVTANAVMLKVLDAIYVVSPVPASPSPAAS